MTRGKDDDEQPSIRLLLTLIPKNMRSLSNDDKIEGLTRRIKDQRWDKIILCQRWRTQRTQRLGNEGRTRVHRFGQHQNLPRSGHVASSEVEKKSFKLNTRVSLRQGRLKFFFFPVYFHTQGTQICTCKECTRKSKHMRKHTSRNLKRLQSPETATRN